MYHLIIIPIVAAIVTQLVKLIIDAKKNQFSWKDLNSYGGMPSSHTAMVVSMAGSVGYIEGWTSAIFAVAVVFAILVIRDAAGLRYQLGIHAKVINKRMSQIPGDESYIFPHLKERMGHTWLEIVAGAASGLIVTAVYTLIFV